MTNGKNESEKMKTTNKIREVPVIKNPMTGRNRGLTSVWFKASDLHVLEIIADPGDLIEIDRGGIQHWGIYAGPAEFPEGPKGGGIVHLGIDMEASPKDHKRGKIVQPTISFNRLKDVVGESPVRINNTDDDSRCGAKDINLMNDRIKNFTSKNRPYDVCDLNCEIFAKYCRYEEEEESGQTVTFLYVLLYVLTNYTITTLVVTAAVAFVVKHVVSLCKDCLASLIGVRPEFLVSLANWVCLASLVAIFFVDGYHWITLAIGQYVVVMDTLVKSVLLLFGVYCSFYELRLRAVASVIVFSYGTCIIAPAYSLCGFGLPAVVYVFGLSCVIIIHGQSYVKSIDQAGLFFVIVSYAFSAVIPTFLVVVVALPFLLRRLKWD